MRLSSNAEAKLRMLFILCLISFAGCSKKVSEPQQENGISMAVSSNAVVTREYFIAPKTTEPGITHALSNHFASVKEGAVLKNVLYVFLPGTSRDPTGCKATTRKAASLGYHSIGLMYDNRVAGNTLCRATGDTTCHRRARLEVIDGVDRHPNVSVNNANSLINRLYKLLVYLNTIYPAQNWGQYILDGKPNWPKIIIAGHSQGGCLAGLIGKYYPIKKVIMISTIDFLDNGKTPDWETLPANKEKYYAITNSADELIPYPTVKIIWDIMGMTIYGSRVNVDRNAPPYSNTHTLITTLTPPAVGTDKFHNSTGVDSYIPKNSAGVYVYDKAWEYLIGK